MNAYEREKCGRRLKSRVPLIGAFLRRRACEDLARDSSARAVPLLVEALNSTDEQVSIIADQALRRLREAAAIDKFCAIWADNRDGRLAQMLEGRGYVARDPVEVRVLSAMKVGRQDLIWGAEAVPILVQALDDRDPAIAAAAEEALRRLTDSAAIDALCRIAMKDPNGKAARISIETGKRPSDIEEACLFLVVTRQLDAYEKEDSEFQNLRPAYERAEPEVRAHVMEVYRTGDRRLDGFIGRAGKPISQCSEAEIRTAIESRLRHKDWPRLFEFFLQLPLKHGFPLLEHFRKSGWMPEDPEMQSLYRQVLADSEGGVIPEPPATSSVFERWLAKGKAEEYLRMGEDELLKRLASATPPDGVALVSALAAKSPRSEKAAQEVQRNEHWLIRLAGYATGLCAVEMDKDGPQDDNYWVRELNNAAGILDFWPGRATPADLERLNSAPAEAWVGRFGALRKVLRTLMAQRIQTGVFEEVVVEAAETAGVFEPVE